MRPISAVLAVMPITATPVEAADLGNLVAVCGDAESAPGDVVRFCRMALDSGGLETRQAAQANLNLGVGYFELGRYPQAIEAYDEAVPPCRPGTLRPRLVRDLGRPAPRLTG